jgi:hypothetical protein
MSNLRQRRKRYSIFVTENTGREFELCRVDQNPEGVADAVRALQKYNSVRIIDNGEAVQ